MNNADSPTASFKKTTAAEYKKLYFVTYKDMYHLEHCDFCKINSKKRHIYYKELKPVKEALDINHIYKFCNNNCFNCWILTTGMS